MADVWRVFDGGSGCGVCTPQLLQEGLSRLGVRCSPLQAKSFVWYFCPPHAGGYASCADSPKPVEEESAFASFVDGFQRVGLSAQTDLQRLCGTLRGWQRRRAACDVRGGEDAFLGSRRVLGPLRPDSPDSPAVVEAADAQSGMMPTCPRRVTVDRAAPPRSWFISTTPSLRLLRLRPLPSESPLK